MQRMRTILLLAIGLLALTIPAAASAHPVKVTYGAQENFVPAAGYPTPLYPFVTRRSKFSAHNWCWGAQLYDASTDPDTYGPYDPSLSPPIFPAEPGLEGGDSCTDPTQASFAVVASASRGPSRYGTFGPSTIVSGLKLDHAVRKLRLYLPDGTVVKLKFVKGTFLYTTNTQLPPFTITVTYELNGTTYSMLPL